MNSSFITSGPGPGGYQQSTAPSSLPVYPQQQNSGTFTQQQGISYQPSLAMGYQQSTAAKIQLYSVGTQQNNQQPNIEFDNMA